MRPTQAELAAACVGRESRVHFNQFTSLGFLIFNSRLR